MARLNLGADSAQRKVVRLVTPPRPLRADVPPFDPTNDAHLRAWEAIYDFGRSASASERRSSLEAQVERDIALLDMMEGDIDLEDGDEDCCAAYDDRIYTMGSMGKFQSWLAEEDEDMEPDDFAEDDDPAGDPLDYGEFDEVVPGAMPKWGLDQAAGYLNADDRDRGIRAMHAG